VTDAFTAPRLIPTVNSDEDDSDPMLSADGCTLYFASSHGDPIGHRHLFRAQVTL
jgi:hypothetical protein